MRRIRKSRPRAQTPLEKVVLYINEVSKTANARKRRALRRARQAMERLYGR